MLKVKTLNIYCFPGVDPGLNNTSQCCDHRLGRDLDDSSQHCNCRLESLLSQLRSKF